MEAQPELEVPPLYQKRDAAVDRVMLTVATWRRPGWREGRSEVWAEVWADEDAPYLDEQECSSH